MIGSAIVAINASKQKVPDSAIDPTAFGDAMFAVALALVVACIVVVLVWTWLDK